MATQTVDERFDTDGALTGEQLRQLSEGIGAGEIDGDHDTVVERLLETLASEDVRKVDVSLSGCKVEVFTETLRLWGLVDDVSGRVKVVTATTREEEWLITEDLAPETVEELPEVRDEIEAAKQRRRDHVPPRKYR